MFDRLKRWFISPRPAATPLNSVCSVDLSSGSQDNNLVDFVKVVRVMVNHLSDQKIPYMIIGAVGMGLHGVPRATKDLDFMIDGKYKEVVEAIMKAEGYEMFNQKKWLQQWSHYLKVFGQVDYILANSKVGVIMIERAEQRVIDQELTVKVACPEDIIGLKIGAIANDPTLEGKYLSDIEEIVHHFGDALNWTDIETCAKLSKGEHIYEKVIKYKRSDGTGPTGISGLHSQP